MGLYRVYCFDSGGECAGLLRHEFTIFRQEQYAVLVPRLTEFVTILRLLGEELEVAS